MSYFGSNIVDYLSFLALRKRVKQNKVKGLIDKEEAYFLYCAALSKKESKARIVEIGSFYGYSTIFLASGSRKRQSGKIVAIDPHYGNPEHQKEDKDFNSYEQFKRNIAAFNLQDWVDARVMPSQEAVKTWGEEPLKLLWIDGNHDYEFVKSDFELWAPFLIKGGILAFHDAGLGTCGWPGPQKLVKEIDQTGQFTPFQFVHGIAWAFKN